MQKLRAGFDYRNEDRTKQPLADVLRSTSIMDCYRGSHAFNLRIDPLENERFGTDDIDFISVYVFPKEYYYTLHGYDHKDEVKEDKHDELDEVAYELRKMFHMLVKLNPNVMPTLYLRKEDYTLMTPAWQHVLDQKEVFINKKNIYETTKGFAFSQKERMLGGVYNGYMGEKRKRLVDDFGYDVKNAVHTIRILRMGIEFLRDGEPVVWRVDDRDELLAIKTGEFTLEHCLSIIENEFKQLDEAFQNSTLPEKTDMKVINTLLYETFELALGQL